MRRVLVVVTVVVAVALGLTAPAGAAPGTALDRQLTGSFSGTSRWTFGEGCSFVHQVYDGTFTPDTGGRTGSYHFDTCVSFVAEDFLVSGTFRIVTAGGTLSGQLSGDLEATLIVVPIDWTLTVTSGTGRFRRATGTIQVVGTLDFIAPLSFRTVDEGRFEASLTRA